MRLVSRLAAIAMFALTTNAAIAAGSNVQIYRPDGTRQCKMGKKIPLAEMKAELVKAHIAVFAAREGTDGRLHPMLCGLPTGKINIFTIAKKDFNAAHKLGFALYPLPDR